MKKVNDDTIKPTFTRSDLVKKDEAIAELTADLQRVQADFENYRKNAEVAKERYGGVVKNTTLMKILPIVDDIERATAHLPANLADDDWAKGVLNLREKLLKSLVEIGVQQIPAAPGIPFNPEFHEAIQMEDGDGDQEVVAEELRAGWLIDGEVARPAMVKVTKK
ncbi:MAG: nucleotide exchange factor GrpE [Candidatus Nomurabacteria bacterium]|jgi:molecular chaperone GrpE|nr:nucleotide exchange factor GrpE [Candidatus Nomurabacteria bacterium]